MIKDFLSISVNYNAAWRRYEFYLLRSDRLGGDVTHVGEPVVLRPLEEGGGWELPPTFWMTDDAAQRLMDELWVAGVRPREAGTIGQIDAMRAHLEDLRRLVFDYLMRCRDD